MNNIRTIINDHTYLHREREGCTIVPVFGGPSVSVGYITPLLYTVLYCAVQRVMAVAWEGACKQSSNITAVSSSQCYRHHQQPWPCCDTHLVTQGQSRVSTLVQCQGLQRCQVTIVTLWHLRWAHYYRVTQCHAGYSYAERWHFQPHYIYIDILNMKDLSRN